MQVNDLMKTRGFLNSKEFLIWTVLFILYIFLYFPLFPNMIYLATDENGDNSHCLLVPFISAFLAWRKRKEIKREDIRPEKYGIIFLVASLSLYIIGHASGIEVLPRLTIVSTLIALIIYNFGTHAFKVFAFPLFFLFFMVPIPVSIVGIVSFPLQLIATKISAFIINSLSIPVLREGNILFFTNSSIEVAQACSGIRSLTAYLMIGILFAYLMNASLSRRIVLIFVAIPLSFFANLLRVTATGILAHFFGSRVARGFLHEFSGLMLFVFGFILLYLFYLLFNTTPINSGSQDREIS